MIRAIMRRQVSRVGFGILLTLVISLGGCSLFAQARPNMHASSSPLHSSGKGERSATRVAPPGSKIVDTPGTSVLVQVADITVTSAAHLTFSGSGFSPGEALAISVTDSRGKTEMRWAPAIADTDGSVASVSLIMPADLPPGTHELIVKGETSQHLAHATFQIQRVPPTVQLVAYTGQPGSVFGVSGNGFASNEAVDVYLGTMNSAPVATLKSGAGGVLVGRVTVPTRPPGEYTMYFVGRTSATPASVGFNIRGFKPWVTLETYSPAVGSTLRASGHDFAPNEAVLVYLNTASGQPIATVQADTRGAFANAVALDISSGLTGHQTLIFVGKYSRVTTQTSFDVFP